MAARVRSLTATDEADWARFAQRIAPLRGTAVTPKPGTSEAPNPVATARATREAPRRGPRLLANGGARSLDIGGQPDGLDAASWQRLRRGRISSARKLDLHGMTAQQAYLALRSFLRTAHADRVRCVEIVTGRGDGERGGVLRRELALWLNLPDIRPLVLAAVHPHTSGAMHSHAVNPGSVRLLLRRPRA